MPNDTKTITISGNNFIGIDTSTGVTIDSNPCTSINVTSVTSLTADVPVGTVGAKTVEVVGVGGTGTLVSGYIYEDAPTVASITPNTGLFSAETPVTMVGDNFVSTPFIVSVKIGGADCTSIVVVDNNNITAVTPTGTAGAQDVVVTTVSGAGTLAGGFTYITYANTYSAFFDGVDDNISTTTGWPELASSGGAPDSGYSVSWWFKSATYPPSTNRFFFAISDTSDKYRLHAWTYGTSGIVMREGNADTVSFDFGYKYLYASQFFVDTLWHHYAITSTGSGSSNGVKFYIDGIFTESFTGKTLGSNLATTRLFIASQYNLGNDLHGNIDEFSMFNTELSGTQVTTLYNNGIPTDLTTHANIQHWWRMGDGIGDEPETIYDQAGGTDWDLDSTPVSGAPLLQTNVPYLIATQADPYYGDTGGSTSITITGSNLADVSAISVGGNPGSITSTSASSVTLDTPAGSAGDADIIITDSTNNSEVTLPNGFFYRTGSVPAWANASNLELDGTNALASREAWPELASSGGAPDSGYSVSWWFKSATYPPTTGRFFFAISDTSNKYRLHAWIYGTSGIVIREGNADTVSFDFGYVYDSLAAFFVDTLWHHYAITSTGSGSSNGVKFYIDGTLTASFTGKTLGSNLAATKLWVGSNMNFGLNLVGNIDEFAIFDTELNPTTVTALYNSGIPTDLSVHANIQHYYRMGDSIGDVATLIRDQVGGLDLDLTEGTPVIDAETPYLIATQADPYYGDATTGGATITITGSNLANVSAISAGGNAFGSISASATSVTAAMADNSTVDAVVDLVITDSTNNSVITLPDGFVYRSGSVPAWVNASSVELDGTNALASREAWPELASSGGAPDSGYSVSWWFKSATYPPTTSRFLFAISDASDKYRLHAWIYGTSGLVMREGNADTVSFSYGQYINSGAAFFVDTLWHHYAITSTGSGSSNGVKFYIDGILTESFTGEDLGSNLAATKLWVGSNMNFGLNLVGNIDEFAIFDTELDSTAVAALYSGGPTDLGLHANIQHYYRMGDSIGDVATLIRDQVGGLDLDITEGTPVIDADVP